MDAITKHPDPDDDAPEIARQQTDVEEGGRSKPVQDRDEGVKQSQNERVACQVPADLAVPHRIPEPSAVEDARLRPIDDHAPPPDLPNNFVERALANQELLGNIAQAIKGGA